MLSLERSRSTLPYVLAAAGGVALAAGLIAGVAAAGVVVAALAAGLLLAPAAVRALRREVKQARLEADHADRAANAMRDANAGLHEKVRALQTRVSDFEREALEMRRRGDAAEEAHRFKCDFLDHVARELRTPLNAVIGFADLLAEDARPDQQPHLKNVQEGGRRMLKVLNQMLELARTEANGVALEEVEAAHLVAAAATAASVIAGQRGVELYTRAPDEARLRCDVPKLKQVLEALISHALSCSPAGSSVEVSAARRGPLVRFSVQDQGGGMDESSLARLFDPFGGAGPIPGGPALDLSVCRRLVELHGGAIEVASRPGAGCTVSFTLPAIT
jgi:signal transduction histidine kinase